MSKVKELSQPIALTYGELSGLLRFHSLEATGYDNAPSSVATCNMHIARMAELNAIRKSMIIEEEVA